MDVRMVLGGPDNILLANNPDAGSGCLKHPCEDQVSMEKLGHTKESITVIAYA